MIPRADRDLLAIYLRPERRRVVLLAALLLAGIGFQLANPLIAKAFIDAAQAGRPFGQLVHLALLFTGAALVTQVATVGEAYVANDLGWRTTNALRADLTAHVLGLDGSFHAAHSAGELIERVDGDVSAIAGFFSRFVVQVAGNVVFLIGVLVVVAALDWRIGAVLAVFAAVAFVFMTRGGGFVGARSKQARGAVADLSGFLEERLGGLPDLKANGADGHATRQLHRYMDRRYQRTRASIIAGSAFGTTISLIFVLAAGASLWLSVVLLHAGVVTLGTVFAVFRYTGMLRYPLEQLARQMNSFQQATGGLVRVRDLLQTDSAVVDEPVGATDLPSGPLAVEFDGVMFAYGDEPVLADLSWSIPPGEVLGVLGRSGSGKTTMARLLFRLHDVARGAVRVGGVDVRHVGLADLRGHIGLVTQDVQLFAGSVRDNVTLFDADVPNARVEAVFRELGLAEWLDHLPAGLDTELGGSGQGLSAGEAQLVALARVFLHDPGLVILDEASSRLDPATERLLQGAVGRLLAGRTGLVIAHRLPTIDRADRVLVLESGGVAEFGPRAELERDPNSRYSQLRRVGLEEAPA